MSSIWSEARLIGRLCSMYIISTLSCATSGLLIDAIVDADDLPSHSFRTVQMNAVNPVFMS